MALTPSNMMELNTIAPEFYLKDVISGEEKSYQDVKGDLGSVVMFICNHCPYVIHVEKEIGRIANDYKIKGIGFVAISSNDIQNYPMDSPEKMLEQVARANFSFPYLYDRTQLVAKSYDAACTPDFYVFNRESRLVYRGRIDESRPGNDSINDGRDLREALDLMINGKRQAENQYPSMGCNIKWKS